MILEILFWKNTELSVIGMCGQKGYGQQSLI